METETSNRVHKSFHGSTTLSQINLIHTLSLKSVVILTDVPKSSKCSVLFTYFWPTVFCIFLQSVPYTSLSSQYSIYYVTVVVIIMKFSVQSFETECRYCTPTRTVSCPSSETQLYSQVVSVATWDLVTYKSTVYLRIWGFHGIVS
jgi:hypothetical protein